MSFENFRQFGVVGWRSVGSPRRRFGVPPNGPWDTEAANVARMLAGLGSGEPVLEVLQGSIELRLGSKGVLSAVGSGGFVSVNGQPYPLASRVPVQAEDSVIVQAHCAYITFSSIQANLIKLDWRPAEPASIRFLPTEPQGDILEVTVSRSFSRAGVRLEGHAPGSQPERPSEPSCVGAIQQTPSGELILIGPDGPNIGGYPKLGFVIEADLHLIPRLKIGQKVDLVSVSWEQARGATAKQVVELGRIQTMLNLTRNL